MSFAAGGLNARAEALAAELRARARAELGQPMEDVAERLRVDVVPVVHLPHRRGVASPEERAILYRPSGYTPRDQFTIAHELMELHLPRNILELDPRLKEQFCNRGAAALLLPQQQFLFSLHGQHWDLPDLRRRWPWASWGAIASRLVDLKPGLAACAWVNGRREWWRWDARFESSLRHVIDAEYNALRAVGRRAVARAGAGLLARAWRLTARQGRRVTVTLVRSG